MLDERDSQGLVALSSPSKPVKDEIAHHSASADSSPNTDQLHAICNSPRWCASQVDSFVRSSGTKDDPFVADAPTLRSSSNG